MSQIVQLRDIDRLATQALEWLTSHPERDWLDAAYWVFERNAQGNGPYQADDWPPLVAEIKHRLGL